MSVEYDAYLKEHKENVIRGLEWMRDHLPSSIIDRYLIEDALVNAQSHDESKFSSDEYPSYDNYFYGNNRSFDVEESFNYAWLHHIHKNPHHWQHWVLVNDEPSMGSQTVALEMPTVYIYEMIADWWSFSWKKGDLCEIFEWYDLHKDFIMLGDETHILVEHILFDGIFPVLKMQMIMRGKWDESQLAHSEMMRKEKNEEAEKEIFEVPKKKFDLSDVEHIKAAILFFNSVDPKDEQQLADELVMALNELDWKLGTIVRVQDDNRFLKYIPADKEDIFK